MSLALNSEATLAAMSAALVPLDLSGFVRLFIDFLTKATKLKRIDGMNM